MDDEIRTLLCACFGQETAFKDRRYAREMPAHRWLLRANDGILIGHVAAHEKSIVLDHALGQFPVIGIAEACTHPDYRLQGNLRKMLERVHKWAGAMGFEFAVLFGHRAIYVSSGYIPAMNLWAESGNERYSEVMVAQLGSRTWPNVSSGRLIGPRF